ncbi:MAG TPA: GNAT family N-acetyltransferase [Gemmatimonadaceae bacterium]|nr:GNAT family N-acetyltransferase [Gemmatimonadaceae bacterium]
MSVAHGVVDNVEFSRFERHGPHGELAVLEYKRSPGMLHLLSTEVPASLEGQGYAGTLARWALDFAAREGLGVGAVCPFVRAYLQKHPEFAHLVKY